MPHTDTNSETSAPLGRPMLVPREGQHAETAVEGWVRWWCRPWTAC